MNELDDWLGVGLYTAPDAARLLGLPTAMIRRWIGGYSYVRNEQRRLVAPLWRSQLPKLDRQLGLGFLDLMQARVVSAFVAAGVGPQAVRSALARATLLLNREHPFTDARFRTDGRGIFLDIANKIGEPKLLDLARSQYTFRPVVEPSFKGVDFDAQAMVRWWPLGRQRQVVLDPQRAFGAPVGAGSGIPTATLAAAVDEEGSVANVTRWFPVSEREVRDAVAFERQLANISAATLAA